MVLSSPARAVKLSQKTIEGLITLVDVRAHPGSRRWPQYNLKPLEQSLNSDHIEYAWLPTLGGRRKARLDSRNTAWRNSAFRGYADYMESTEFTSAAAKIRSLAGKSTTCYMCPESLWVAMPSGLDIRLSQSPRPTGPAYPQRWQEEHPYSPLPKSVMAACRMPPPSNIGVLAAGSKNCLALPAFNKPDRAKCRVSPFVHPAGRNLHPAASRAAPRLLNWGRWHYPVWGGGRR